MPYGSRMRRSERLAAVGVPPDDPAWSAIARRLPSAAATHFLVTTTGIVCRVECPSRRPRRDHVRVVPGPAVAIRAGARPCLRCRPVDQAPSTRPGAGPLRPVDGGSGTEGARIASAVIARLDEALAGDVEPPGDRELAAEHGVTERRLRALMREAVGVSPRAWVAAARADRLRGLLATRPGVLDALLDAGYSSSSAAYEAASATLGMPPGAYRSGGEGRRIGWTVVETTEGPVLVAATDRGLCSVRFGEDEAALQAELRREFPRASLERDDAGLAPAAAIVRDLAAGRARRDASLLALDPQGTAFRRLVWDELRRIPAGETRTYRQVAEAVATPAFSRAVASACAANPLALVVPCHRVVGSDGALHGYRWGIGRKRRLLEAEAAAG